MLETILNHLPILHENKNKRVLEAESAGSRKELFPDTECTALSTVQMEMVAMSSCFVLVYLVPYVI